MTQEERDIKFIDCYSRFHNFMSNYCQRFIRDRDDRADVVHDAFLKIYKNLHQFKNKSNINTWMFAIARNTCLNHIKTTQYKVSKQYISLDKIILASKKPDPENDFINKKGVSSLKKAISDLGEMQQQEIEYLLSGFKSKEIAKMTNRSDDTVRKSLSRTKKHLIVKQHNSRGKT